MTKNITINNEQELYVIPEGKWITCMGFDVVIQRIKSLAKELHLPYNNLNRGSIEAYETYLNIVEIARQKFINSGWRSTSDLYSPFIGHEGKRVEVTYTWGEKERFYIGKSTGWIPCHLMVKKSNSTGGCSVLNNSIKSFRFV